MNIMFEQDYVMRMIKDLVKFFAKVLLNKETITYELSDNEKYAQSDDLHKELLSLVMIGKINEAENLLFERLDSKDMKYMELALDFYQRFNNLDDEFLEKNNFSREEIEEGLRGIAKQFGISMYK